MVIRADKAKISNTAKTVRDLKDDLDPAMKDVNKIAVEPGNFRAANDLKTAVNARKGEVVTFGNNIKEEVDDIADKLDKNADNVQTTEDENQWTVTKNMPSNY
jgi:hypothetical protein